MSAHGRASRKSERRRPTLLPARPAIHGATAAAAPAPDAEDGDEARFAAAYALVAGELGRVREAVAATGRDPREVLDLPLVGRALEDGGPLLRQALARSILGIDQREAARAQALGVPYRDLIAAGAATTRDFAVPGYAADFRPDIERAAGLPARPTGTPGTANQATGGNTAGSWMGAGNRDAPVGIPNAALLRQWADQLPPVRAAINARRDRVAGADIAVEPTDSAKKLTAPQRQVQRQVTLLLDQPNPERQNWAEFMGSWVEDFLVLARGCIEKAMSVKRTPQALWVQDGAAVKVYPGWDGDPAAPRYLYEEPGTGRKVPLRNDELIMALDNAASYRYGLSRVQILRDTVMALAAAMKSGSDLVANKPPPTLIQIPKASQPAIDNLRARYEAESAGKRQIWLMGGDEPVKVQALLSSLKDSQWLEWQVYLIRLVCAVFAISPQVLGLTMDVNRATSESQERITEDGGLIPLFLTLEAYLNRELLSDFAPRFPDGRTNLDALNLRVLFPEVSEGMRMVHAERTVDLGVKALAGLPTMTLNMVLSAMGEQPVDGGDVFWVFSPTNGPMPWLGYTTDTGAFGGPGDVGAQQGAQDAAGGPASDQADARGDPRDTGGTGPKLPQQTGGPGANAQTQGDEGTPSFNGSDDGGPAVSGGAPGVGKSVGVATVGDRRRPGTRWSPRVEVPRPKLVVPAAYLRALSPPAPQPVAPSVPAAPARREPEPLERLPRMAWHTIDRTKAAEAVAAAKAAGAPRLAGEAYDRTGEDGEHEHGALPRIGRVPEHVADAHHRPHAEVKARAEVRSAVHRTFETAAQRGRHATPPVAE